MQLRRRSGNCTMMTPGSLVWEASSPAGMSVSASPARSCERRGLCAEPGLTAVMTLRTERKAQRNPGINGHPLWPSPGTSWSPVSVSDFAGRAAAHHPMLRCMTCQTKLRSTEVARLVSRQQLPAFDGVMLLPDSNATVVHRPGCATPSMVSRDWPGNILPQHIC